MDRICDLARRLQQLLELVCYTLRLGRPLRQRPLKGTIMVRIPTPVNKDFFPPPTPTPQSVYLLASIAQAMHPYSDHGNQKNNQRNVFISQLPVSHRISRMCVHAKRLYSCLLCVISRGRDMGVGLIHLWLQQWPIEFHF